MKDQESNNKRIAKNTMFLYFRMLFVLLISLFTSRVVLATLGEVDFGLYNVIGGVVTTFTFISMAMSNASSRFITFSLGKCDPENLRKVFNTVLWIHISLALFILLLAETIGLWFVNTQMTISAERMGAANWVYQFSIVSTLIGIISIPFNSEIIAHEKMGAFAYISIFDVTMKLVIVYLLYKSPYDKLIVYATLLTLIQFFDTSLYIIYCKINFAEIVLQRMKDYSLVKKMMSFAGWSLIGNLSFVCYTEGLNILLNMFFGPAVNAARGIAVQVQTAVMNFILNFQTAVSPQITKSYAIGDIDRMQTLMQKSSKFSFYILFCMFLPIVLETKTILGLWLGEFPDHTVAFLRLILIISIIDCLTRPVTISMNATGNIKYYQIISCGILLLIVPSSYLCLKLGMQAETVFIVHFAFALIAMAAELVILHKILKLKVSKYVNAVVVPILKVVIVASIIPTFLYLIAPDNLFNSIINIIIAILSVILTVYIVGMTNSERNLVVGKIKKFIMKK